MLPPVNYVIQVALVAASWCLFVANSPPVGRASQISSVWYTDETPKQQRNNQPDLIDNHDKLSPLTSTNSLILKTNDHQSERTRQDFSSFLAGNSQSPSAAAADQRHQSAVDYPQASSFRATVVDYEAANDNTTGNPQQHKQPATTNTRNKITNNHDSRRFAFDSSSAANAHHQPAIESIKRSDIFNISYTHSEPSIASVHSADQPNHLPNFDTNHNQLVSIEQANNESSSLNRQVHFDEEHLQQHQHREAAPKNHQEATPLVSNDMGLDPVTNGYQLDEDEPRYQRQANKNQNFNYHYNNSSSQFVGNNNTNLLFEDGMNRAFIPTTVNLLDDIEPATRAAPMPSGDSIGPNELDQLGMRPRRQPEFTINSSLANHERDHEPTYPHRFSNQLDANKSTTSSGWAFQHQQPQRASPTNDQPTSPFVYFSPDGDKWNQQQNTQTESPHTEPAPTMKLPIGSSPIASNELFRQTTPILALDPVALSHNNHPNHNQKAIKQRDPLLKNQMAKQGDRSRRKHQHQEHGLFYQLVNSHSINDDNPSNQLTRASHHAGEESKRSDGFGPLSREEIMVLRHQQLQLRRLRNRAILQQLERKRVLADKLNSLALLEAQAQQNEAPANRQSGQATENRAWLLGSLGQKLNLRQHHQPALSFHYNNEQLEPSSLERYFYQDHETRPPTTSLRLPVGSKPRLIARPPPLPASRGPQLATIYSLGAFPSAYPMGAPVIRETSVPRAPSHLTNYDRHLTANSFEQASFSEAPILPQRPHPSLAAAAARAPKQAPASFIPVVAVTVTKTSPAPKAPSHDVDDEPTRDEGNTPVGSSDIDDYIERKVGGRTYVSNKGTSSQQAANSNSNDSNEYGNSASGSMLSQQRQNNGAMTSGNQAGHSLARGHQQQAHHTTTVKSAVFGYMPNQLHELPASPIYGVINQALGQENQLLGGGSLSGSGPGQQADFYQPVGQELPLSLQLQANSLVQNDIVHPFQTPEHQQRPSSFDNTASYYQNPQHATYTTQQNFQKSLQNHNPTHYNPATGHILNGPIVAGTADQNSLQAGHQLIAVAASELNPALSAFMVPGAHPGTTQLLGALKPGSMFEPITLKTNQRQRQRHQHQQNFDQSIDQSSSSSPASRGKKRSSDFFASAGQLLLSALPLLLAPTLGLMFASMPIPMVARNQNLLQEQQQHQGGLLAQTLQTGIPGSYINSLANGQVTGSIGTAQVFTPTPPILYEAPVNVPSTFSSNGLPNLSHQQQLGVQNKPKSKPTKSPQNRAKPASRLNYNNGGSYDLSSLINGTERPAAIVFTTTSPTYAQSNHHNNTTSRQQQGTVTAVDSLNLVSNQTLVFIPPDRQTDRNSTNSIHEQPEIASGAPSYLINDTSSVMNESLGDQSNDGDQEQGVNSNRVHLSSPETYAPAQLEPQHQSTLISSINSNDNNNHKRRHHYDLATGSLLEGGADFDTQYASIGVNNNNKTALQALDLMGPRTEMNVSTSQNHNAQPTTRSPDEAHDPSHTKLYPVSTWPTLRRRTVSLVTSQGNRTFSDASDRYPTTPQTSSEFNLDGVSASVPSSGQEAGPKITAKTSHRILRRKMVKREVASPNDESEKLELDDSSRRLIRSPKARVVTATIITNLEAANSSDLMEVDEARRLRNELLDKRNNQFVRLGSSEGALLDLDPPTVSIEHWQHQQKLADGSRGQIAIPVHSPAGAPKMRSNGRRHQHEQHQPIELSEETKQAVADLGQLILKDQKNHLKRDQQFNDSARDSADLEPITTERSVVLLTSDEAEPLGRIGSAESQPTASNNKRRSADFSRQFRYSNQLNSDSTKRPEELHPQKANNHQQNMKHPEADLNINLHWAQRDSSNNQTAPMSQMSASQSPVIDNHNLTPIQVQRLQQQQQQQQQNYDSNNPRRRHSATSPIGFSNEFKPMNTYSHHNHNNNYNNHQLIGAPESGSYISNLGSSTMSDLHLVSGPDHERYFPDQQTYNQQQYQSNHNYNNNNHNVDLHGNLHPQTNQLPYPTRNHNYHPHAARDPYAPSSYNISYARAMNPGAGMGHYYQPTAHSAVGGRMVSGSMQSEDYAPMHEHGQLGYRLQDQLSHNAHQATRSRAPSYYNADHGAGNQHSNEYYARAHSHQMAGDPYGDSGVVPIRSIGPNGSMELNPMGLGSGPYTAAPQMAHFAAGSMLTHQAGPLASLAANNSQDTGTVNEYLKQVQFSDSDRDKLMASYLTCDGLLNDNDHCLERLSCEFSDPQNIEKANKLDRAVSSILLGHILINTYIPNNFKYRLKSASIFGFKHSGKCNRYVCNKLIKQQVQSPSANTSSGSSNSSNSADVADQR